MVNQVQKLRKEVGCSYRTVCETTGVPYSSLMRWKRCKEAGKPVVKRPGMKKKKTIDRDELEKQVRKLNHCNKVSLGSWELFEDYRHGISRREFQCIVAEARADAKRERRETMRRTQWHVPGLAWGMDDTKRRGLPVKVKMSMNQLRDLCSRNALSATVTERLLPEGKVAELLEEQFQRHGAPMIFKCDNGSNLNGGSVYDVCDEHVVLVLNSPPYYPQYNGLLEWSQWELKSHMAWLLQGMNPDLATVQMAATFTRDRLNRWPRPCLRYRTADEVFEARHTAMCLYTKDKRKEVRETITTMAMHIMADMDKSDPRAEQAAWRIAVETWLRRNGLITVSSKRNCYPIETAFWSHL